MPNHMTSSRIRRNSVIGAAAVVLLGLVATVGASAATARPAGAAGSTTTYSATTVRPGPLPAAYASSANSDGWAVALSSTQVFNVTHHLSTLDVTCHSQSTGSPCWSPDQTKNITHGSDNYATPLGAGLYLDQTTGHLFTYAVQTGPNPANDTAGVVCIDTSNPATATFCGFTALSATGEAPIPGGQYAGISAPVQVGNDWYAFNEVSGVGTAGGAQHTENTLMCFSLTTFSACSTPNYTIPLTPPNQVVQVVFGAAPPAGSAGSDVFIPLNTGSGGNVDQMLCFDTTTGAACAGSAWPVALPNLAGSPFPLLNGSGTATGVCVPVAGVPCFNLDGTPATTPGSLASVVGLTNKANGPSTTIGTQVYVPNYTTTAVDCFNYASGTSCANFPKVLQGLTDLYTVNPDTFRSNCIWVNSDNGPDQIQNFDATTGGQCAPGPVRLQASSLVSSDPACTLSPSYQSLQILSPARSTYNSATVQFADGQGTIQQGQGSVNVDSFGGFDISGNNAAGNPLPQFVITFSGEASVPATVVLKLTWQAAASSAPQCVAQGQSSTNAPGYWMVATDGGIFNYGNAGFFGSTGNLHLNQPVVGMALTPDHQGYWLVASDGGIFAYGDAGFYGSTGAMHLNQPIVGMASTSTGHGYWMVARDGGIFAFGDAGFYGSAGNLKLNKPVVGMATSPDGGGYWMVASDGGIFAYGNAGFYGSTGNLTLNKPVVGMAANPKGGGYWMVASDGGIFAYGNAGFYGSTGNLTLNKPVVGMAPLFDGSGYWLAASDGGIFNYGNAGFAGSAGGLVLNKPIVQIAA